jgi:hypothetical protein
LETYVIVVFRKRFPEAINFSSRASSVQLCNLPLQSLIGPVEDVPDSVRMEII